MVGRSNIVGLPAALLLQRRDATVTVVHSRTPEPEKIIREADIVIAALGKAEWVRGSWLKPGCAVIDVGINAVDDPGSKKGYKLVGDVNYAEAEPVAGGERVPRHSCMTSTPCMVAAMSTGAFPALAAITPVPGGVGPMTIAMLLRNTVDGARRAFSSSP